MRPNVIPQCVKAKVRIGEESAPPSELYDPRFRRLLSAEDWAGLPAAVRKRFSKRIEGARVAIYPGVIRKVRFSGLGWCLAQICRLIGAPLPLHRDIGVPAAVSVSEDGESAGQCWTRVYGRKRGFPQVVHSAKRFAGDTGLEEHIGCGIAMALRVEPIEEGLAFISDHYLLHLGRWRLRLPHWLEPGRTTVRHIDQSDGGFLFSLELRHPIFGELLYQEGEFRDA